MSITLTSIRIDIPVTRVWDATYMANPRMSVDPNHTGAGTRA